jgi:prepilin-type N-terminal cleavage/methylation domain-containing protein
MKKSKGFTLIEILVVISITLIFLGISLVQFNSYTEQTKLKNEAKKLIDVLELAKKKSLSADLVGNCNNFTGYRVTVSAGAYSLLFGCDSVYSVVQSYNLPTNITVTEGDVDYNFSPLMNNPSFISNTIKLQNSSIGTANKCIDISISPIGIVELGNTLISC